MDLEAFVAAHHDEWERLRQLTNRRRLSGVEADELVSLYRAASTHLSQIQTSAPDPTTVGKLSELVARARGAIAGAHDPGWRDVVRFMTVSFPATVYRCRHWWISAALASVSLAIIMAWWVAGNPEVQAAIAAPEEIAQLVEHDFENYYSEHAASAFAFRVWVNNAWVSAAALVLGVFLIPVVYLLGVNVINVAVAAGFMASAGRLDVFFGLITPHGLLELTAVFVAAGVGLRLGWTVIDPGSRPRSVALAETGRATIGVAVGLVGVLLISGVIEAFVTPSGLPTWARIGIGVVAETLFLGYIWTYGRRAVAAGESGDIAARDRGSILPTSG